MELIRSFGRPLAEKTLLLAIVIGLLRSLHLGISFGRPADESPDQSMMSGARSSQSHVSITCRGLLLIYQTSLIESAPPPFGHLINLLPGNSC